MTARWPWLYGTDWERRMWETGCNRFGFRRSTWHAIDADVSWRVGAPR